MVTKVVVTKVVVVATIDALDALVVVVSLPLFIMLSFSIATRAELPSAALPSAFIVIIYRVPLFIPDIFT